MDHCTQHNTRGYSQAQLDFANSAIDHACVDVWSSGCGQSSDDPAGPCLGCGLVSDDPACPCLGCGLVSDDPVAAAVTGMISYRNVEYQRIVSDALRASESLAVALRRGERWPVTVGDEVRSSTGVRGIVDGIDSGGLVWVAWDAGGDVGCRVAYTRDDAIALRYGLAPWDRKGAWDRKARSGGCR